MLLPEFRRRTGRRRLRLALNVPYLLLVLAFVGFDAFETVRFGGSVNVPGGVGPGAWLGVAGALLSAQAAISGAAAVDETRPVGGRGRPRSSATSSMVAAALSFVFNLYWRVRYALHDASGSADFGKQNIAVIATAAVYGVVALIAVLVASRWLVAPEQGLPTGDDRAGGLDAGRRDHGVDSPRRP